MTRSEVSLGWYAKEGRALPPKTHIGAEHELLRVATSLLRTEEVMVVVWGLGGDEAPWDNEWE